MFNKLNSVLFVLVLAISSSFPFNAKADTRDKVGLLVMLDMSSSTSNHRKKLKNLAPLVKKVMEQSRCDFKVGVGNIAYDNFVSNDLTPWGEPAFVTMDTPDAENIIWKRIDDPESVLFPNGTISGDDETPRGNSERTYSSMVEAVKQNMDQLEDTISLGILLLTDTAPAFETFEPKEALDQINETLGTRSFIPGMIRPNFRNGMMIEQWDVNTSEDEEGSSICRLDIPGDQRAGEMVNTSTWQSQDLESMDRFIEEAWGSSWDICEKDYDSSIEEYLKSVLLQSGCSLLM